MFANWFGLAMLAAEAQQVIWLRCLKLATGGAAARTEARRMTSEKVITAAQAAVGAMTGDAPAKTVRRYRKRVRANRRRLLKKG